MLIFSSSSHLLIYFTSVIRPVEEDGNDVDKELGVGKELSQAASQVTLEAEELALLALRPVKGLLLYGPPGCG